MTDLLAEQDKTCLHSANEMQLHEAMHQQHNCREPNLHLVFMLLWQSVDGTSLQAVMSNMEQ